MFPFPSPPNQALLAWHSPRAYLCPDAPRRVSRDDAARFAYRFLGFISLPSKPRPLSTPYARPPFPEVYIPLAFPLKFFPSAWPECSFLLLLIGLPHNRNTSPPCGSSHPQSSFKFLLCPPFSWLFTFSLSFQYFLAPLCRLCFFFADPLTIPL